MLKHSPLPMYHSADPNWTATCLRIYIRTGKEEDWRLVLRNSKKKKVFHCVSKGRSSSNNVSRL